MPFIIELINAGAGSPLRAEPHRTDAIHAASAVTSTAEELLASDDLEDRLTAVLQPDLCAERLARAYDGVLDDARPSAALLRAVVAARLRVAWRRAHAPVKHVRIARAAAGRIPLPMTVEVLRRALTWSWPVRATVGRWLAENPDPIAAQAGDAWRDHA